MAIVLPVACGGKLMGSATLVAVHGRFVILATAAHILGEGEQVQIVLPKHGGDCSLPQEYPFDQLPALEATVLAVDPFTDIAMLSIVPDSASIPQLPRFVAGPAQIRVGTEIVVLGYPFAPLGSVLETWTPGFITAKARRKIAEKVHVDEIVLSNVGHPGSSGSAVIGRADGVLYGILRGSLAPPEVMKIGNIPIATDTSVTFASIGSVVPALIADSIKGLVP